ncbi:MAG: transcription-repair coupling factor [Bacteroidota bacterium]|nr:transcription-repair coupling factor [Bacteroidota bacterium]
MNLKKLKNLYKESQNTAKIIESLLLNNAVKINILGVTGSARGIIASAIIKKLRRPHLFIFPDREVAAFFLNDLENIFGEQELPFDSKRILFYPTSYKKPYQIEEVDNANVLQRANVMSKINAHEFNPVIVTYPEALSEKVVTKEYIESNTFSVNKGDNISVDFIIDFLVSYEFERTDFVVEPGQFSIRGGIIDIFSFSSHLPYRIEMMGNEIESIRTFDPSSQLSVTYLENLTITPNIQNRTLNERRQTFFEYMSANTVVWIETFDLCIDIIRKEFEKAVNIYEGLGTEIKHLSPDELFLDEKIFVEQVKKFSVVEAGKRSYFSPDETVTYNINPQPPFNKNFELLLQNLIENKNNNYTNLLLSDNQKQIQRIFSIIEDILVNNKSGRTIGDIDLKPIETQLHEGFIDKDLRVACYTDHQIFDRYHRFHLDESFARKDAITLKELYDLQPGDYVTHIDHGVGRFGGLEKIDVNGKQQEAIRLIYKDNDILYISIHSLHRISKYRGKDGTEPVVNRLGSNAWNNLKKKTKQKVKDIAKDLIKLYAERKSKKGFSFSPDTYIQNELEASFIYEDTPDQIKCTTDFKKDMESESPMDRLICGDVGFGKTEIAIRAAFKAVNDNKQVAVLVPTTILAMQHYKTFSDRLKDFPCNVDYINRFKTTGQQSESKIKLKEGKTDIIIGTHRLVSKDIEYKDLGLLIIDEEQKFGVSAKEKLKMIKSNVDTLTLTATPIPRTLQFSLMGARDLSVINTPPPNRYPIHTEVHPFKEEIIRDAIMYEVSRGGQVFFIHNRVENITEIAGIVQRLCPDVGVRYAHGQMDGHKLEEIMLSFIENEFDVLISTTIVESGLDIPNANTIIINNAHHFGLSDLHQMRGRVGRTNKKAFCYLLAPPLSLLTPEARKRLQAIEEFSDLGSGINIAMKDLEIRGAGNLLGSEQSGFISEIGFDMYHKILDEAIAELKETDFKDLFHEEKHEDFVKDCHIETDLEILIPDAYVSNSTERLNLYKELDNMDTEENLVAFRERLIDRFGPVPPQTEQLIDTIRLRWVTKELGFEKIVLKTNTFKGYFISNQESPYFQSGRFTKILEFIQMNPRICKLREDKNKLSLTIVNIKTINEILNTLKGLA